MLVKTKNTTYEILDGKVRWVETKNPDSNTGVTNEFRKYGGIIGPHIGEGMIISWPCKKGERCVCTTTTVVLEIEDDEPETVWVK